MRRFRRGRPFRRRFRRRGNNIEVSQIYDVFSVGVPTDTPPTSPLTITTVYLEQIDFFRTKNINPAALPGDLFVTETPGLKAVKVVGVRATTNIWLARSPSGVTSDDGELIDVQAAVGWWVDGGSSFSTPGLSGLVPSFLNTVGPNYFANEFSDPSALTPTETSMEWSFPRRTLHRQWARIRTATDNPQGLESGSGTQFFQQWNTARLKAFNLGDRDIFAQTVNLTSNATGGIDPSNETVIAVQNGLVVRYRLQF